MAVFTEHSMIHELHHEGDKIVRLVLGGLGVFHATTLTPQAMLHIERLKCFGV